MNQIPEFGPMRIVSLEVENVKRVEAVHIRPDGNLVVIGGNNAQGKSSVLDSIWMALAARTATNKTIPDPLRAGTDRGQVTIDLGQIRVTRTFEPEGKSNLRVTSADGSAFKSPAKLLDDLVGQISFDPLEFVRMPPREQVAALLQVIDLDIDLDEMARRRAQLVDARTEAGRQARWHQTHVDQLPNPTIDESWNLDGRKLEEELHHTAEVVDQARAVEAKLGEMERHRDGLLEQLRSLETRLQQGEELIADLRAQQTRIVDRIVKLRPAAEITKDLAVLAERAELVRQAGEYAKARRDAAEQAEEHRLLDAQIAGLDRERREAIAAARMPVMGLSFDEDGLTFMGHRLQQAAASEQLRVCAAIAAAANPTVRVIRIADGSLLDDRSMAMLADLAEQHDMQVWVERVGQGDKQAIIIEDGHVARGGQDG